MTRSQQQLAALAALLIVLVAVYARALRSAPQTRTPRAQVSVPVPAAPSQRAAVEPSAPVSSEQRDVQRQRAAHLLWGRDPFTRGAIAGQISGLTLSGILWDPTTPLALINGQMLRVGDELEGYRVVDIVRDRVSVTDGTHTFQLQLAP